jgi:hypothetical protein
MRRAAALIEAHPSLALQLLLGFQPLCLLSRRYHCSLSWRLRSTTRRQFATLISDAGSDHTSIGIFDAHHEVGRKMDAGVSISLATRSVSRRNRRLVASRADLSPRGASVTRPPKTLSWLVAKHHAYYRPTCRRELSFTNSLNPDACGSALAAQTGLHCASGAAAG